MASPTGPIEIQIREKLEREFAPQFLDLVNESHTHSVPKNSETHFKLVLVSEKFVGLNRVARQRLVNDLLKSEMSVGGVHALTQRALTPEEWASQAAKPDAPAFESPACFGGSKREKR